MEWPETPNCLTVLQVPLGEFMADAYRTLHLSVVCLPCRQLANRGADRTVL